MTPDLPSCTAISPEFAQIFHYSLCEGCSRRVMSSRVVKIAVNYSLHDTRAVRLVLTLI